VLNTLIDGFGRERVNSTPRREKFENLHKVFGLHLYIHLPVILLAGDLHLFTFQVGCKTIIMCIQTVSRLPLNSDV
jgi:hypothetical protein